MKEKSGQSRPRRHGVMSALHADRCLPSGTPLQEFRPVTIEELEGKRRKEIEDGLMKRDIKRAKLQEAHNAPEVLAREAEMNATAMVRRRGKLMLPAPQISEVELEQIARMSTEAVLDQEVGGPGEWGCEAGSGLMEVISHHLPVL